MGLFPAVDTIDTTYTISTNIEISPFAETLSLLAENPRVLGVDVSKWQGVMDWQKCYNAGAKYAFIRAGSIDNLTGVPYYDYQYPLNAMDAPKYLPVGFYWYFRPNHDPLVQADYFCDLIEDDSWLLPPVIDVEDAGGKTPGQVADAVIAFLVRVFERLGFLPIIYTRASFWNPSVAIRDNWSLYDLWIARYTTLPEPWGNVGDGTWLKPRDWTEWTFWQHSADGNGLGNVYGAESDSIDLDYFNGDEQDLADYIGVLPKMPSVVQVITSINVVLRAEPGAGERLGIAFLDEQAAVLSEGEDVDGKLWYEIVIKSAGIIRRGFVPASSVVIIVID